MEALGQVAAVAAVLGLLAGTLGWLRGRGSIAAPLRLRTRGGRHLQAVERLPLSPQHTLHLIRLAGRALLVSSSPSGCALLEAREWSEVERHLEARP